MGCSRITSSPKTITSKMFSFSRERIARIGFERLFLSIAQMPRRSFVSSGSSTMLGDETTSGMGWWRDASSSIASGAAGRAPRPLGRGGGATQKARRTAGRGEVVCKGRKVVAKWLL